MLPAPQAAVLRGVSGRARRPAGWPRPHRPSAPRFRSVRASSGRPREARGLASHLNGAAATHAERDLDTDAWSPRPTPRPARAPPAAGSVSSTRTKVQGAEGIGNGAVL